MNLAHRILCFAAGFVFFVMANVALMVTPTESAPLLLHVFDFTIFVVAEFLACLFIDIAFLCPSDKRIVATDNAIEPLTESGYRSFPKTKKSE